MAYEDHETIKRTWQKFIRDQLAKIPPEDRIKFEHKFEERFEALLKNSAGNGKDGFLDLIGFGDKGVPPFEDLSYPYITPDFDASVIPSPLHATAELYYIYQHERMKVFQVVDVLRRLFRLGRIRIQRGLEARGLYLLEKMETASVHNSGQGAFVQACFQLRRSPGTVRVHSQQKFPQPVGGDEFRILQMPEKR